MEEADPSFEPLQRARSNTWPLPRPDGYVDVDVKEEPGGGVNDVSLLHGGGGGIGGGGVGVAGGVSDGLGGGGAGGVAPKKNSSRRNAWGNMSYADLITQAIHSSADKRLTLSQIYDWMVQNVPYFKDKGDSNSSAGWKNSIRHNLSLHNRFMRVQNEGTGKSSWWMINPDAKPGKAARRRATSMETQKYEKKRGRVKKKVEALRNGLLLPDGHGAAATPSPSSSISESLDMFPESPLHSGFQLSPDFRQRAGSNASSCGGRLSPIPAIEADMHDRQVPPMSPAWDAIYSSNDNDGVVGAGGGVGGGYGTDQLVDTLTETLLLGGGGGGGGGGGDANASAAAVAYGLEGSPGQLSPRLHSLQPSPSNGYALYANSPAGSRYSDYSPSYNDAPNKLSPQRLLADPLNGSNAYSLTNIQALSPAHSVHSLSPPTSVDTQQQQRPPEPVLSPPHSSAYPNSAACSSGVAAGPSAAYCALTPPGGAPPSASPSAMLRAALSPPMLGGGGGGASLLPTTLSSQRSVNQSVSQMIGQLLAINNGMPNDLDLSMDSLQGGLECDVDQVIRHELGEDGNLDFNFQTPDASSAASSSSSSAASLSATSGRHWVH